jgi:nitroimidazol reductase NimA-like FMN-containing flavoprotein (pyridoxamine 5'-phosphate oxidase superfamily)
MGIHLGFDLDGFLAQPLVARVATSGPRVRPVWFLWEDRCFWWLTGSWSRLAADLEGDPRVALVVDTCEPATGRVLQVTAHGEAEVVAFDAGRARRKLARYLGPDEERWDERFTGGTFADPTARFVRLAAARIGARDLSFAVASN